MTTTNPNPHASHTNAAGTCLRDSAVRFARRRGMDTVVRTPATHGRVEMPAPEEVFDDGLRASIEAGQRPALGGGLLRRR